MSPVSLSDAAADVLARLQALDIDALVQRLDTLTGETRAHVEALDQDWDAFWPAALALVGRVESECERIGREAVEAGEALARLGPAAGNVTPALDQACTAAHGALDEVAARAGLLHAALPEWGEAQIFAPTERLAAGIESLETALTRTVDTVSAAFEGEVREQVAEHGTLLQLYEPATARLAAAGGALLATLFEEWAGRLDGVVDLAESAGFTPALAHVGEAVAEALDECEAAQHAALQAAAAPVGTAAEALAELSGDAERQAQGFTAAQHVLDAATQSLVSAVEASTADLEGVSAVLAAARLLATRP